MDTRWTYMVNWLKDRTHRIPDITYRKGVTHKKLTNPVK
jgi:hypothetical protein